MATKKGVTKAPSNGNGKGKGQNGPSLKSILGGLQDQYQAARTKGSNRWTPPPGQYTCLLTGFAYGTKSSESGEYHWFRLDWKVAEGEYEGQEFAQFMDDRAVPYKDKETGDPREFYPGLNDLKSAASIINGEEINDAVEAGEFLSATAEEGTTVCNLEVDFRLGKTGKKYAEYEILAKAA